MASIDALVTQTRVAGLPVELTIEGTARDLPPGVDLTAYRIVQEALTNAIKHAGPHARSTVRLRYGDTDLELEVTDDGRGRRPDDDGTPAGHGLVGMRERVTLFGGTLHVGDRPGGGFVIRARLPYEAAAEPERSSPPAVRTP
jgi:signal transduction histidine kinase